MIIELDNEDSVLLLKHLYSEACKVIVKPYQYKVIQELQKAIKTNCPKGMKIDGTWIYIEDLPCMVGVK